jgi:23S rRNA pseudouridine2604 synthase
MKLMIYGRRLIVSDEKIRLSKLMSEKGICSRREADEYIAKGLVMVNGQVISELGYKVDRNVRVTLATEALQRQKSLATIILNKPIGYVSAQPEKDYEPAIRLVVRSNYFGTDTPDISTEMYDGLAVAGRLDIDSQGLLIFTQDGRLAKKIIGENSDVEKEYLVRVQGNLPDSKLKLLNHGLSLDDRPLKPAKVEWINQDQLRFVLREGRHRQIRRMCELVGLQVVGLKRVRVGQLKLGTLPEGQWRFLRPNEKI